MQIDKLESNIFTLQNDLNRMIQIESEGMTRNIKSCQEMIDKLAQEVEYLSQQLLSKDD